MVLLTLSLLAIAASCALVLYFRRRFHDAPAWGTIVRAALVVMSLRLSAVALGTYWLRSTGRGQVLGQLLVSAGLPEIALAGREAPGGGGAWLLTALAAVALGSLLWVSAIGIIALELRRRRPVPPDRP